MDNKKLSGVRHFIRAYGMYEVKTWLVVFVLPPSGTEDGLLEG
jgi:hypothetical protein